MALIKCSECGREISDTAKICPHCGYKTAYAQKNEQAKTIMHMSLIVNLICISLYIIGAILFFSGISKLDDYGYSFFSDNWANSYRDSVVEAGRKGIIGIVLLVIGFCVSIIYAKIIRRLRLNSNNDATSSPVDKKTEIDPEGLSSSPENATPYTAVDEFITISTIPENKQCRGILGKCDMCDTCGPTALCSIPDSNDMYELCLDCINQYMAEIL